MGKLSDFLERVAEGKEGHYDMVDFLKSVPKSEHKDLDWGIEELCNKYNWEALKWYQEDEINEAELSLAEKKATNINRFRSKWNELKNSDTEESPTKRFKTTFSDQQLSKLYDLLIENNFICSSVNKDNFIWLFGGTKNDQTNTSIKWLKQRNLCSYLLDCLFGEKGDNYWHIGESVFGITGLRQLKNNYLGNKIGDGKPKGYSEIDTIIQNIK